MKDRIIASLKGNKKKLIAIVLGLIIAMAGLNVSQETQDNLVNAVSEVVVVE